MKGLIFIRTVVRYVIPVIGTDGLVHQVRGALLHAVGRLRGKAPLLQKARQNIGNIIKTVDLRCFPLRLILIMTFRHGNHNPIGDKIPKAAQALFQLGYRRITSVFLIIIVNIFYDIAVEFFLRPDQGFDPSPKREGKERILPGHIFIKLPDLLGLGRQEIIMSQKLPDLQEKITVDHIDLIAVLLGFFPKIVHIILQNPKDRISRI